MRPVTTTLLSLATALALAWGAPAAAADTKYGAGVSKAPPVKISELLAQPDRYQGKVVRVEGLVTDVCAKRGCWMQLASDKEFQVLQIKVDDGVMIFPLDAKGKMASAEGVFTRLEIPPEPGEASKQPRIGYRIQATGAVIRQ